MTDRLPLPLEKHVQKAVADLFSQVGGIVNNLSQGYRPGGRRHGTTRQSKGLGDLYVQFPVKGVALWWETKRQGGTQTEDQRKFQWRNEACGVPSGCGGVPEAVEMLKRLGFPVLR